MKRFDTPVIDVQRINPDGVIATSTCQVCNTVGCIECYCGFVTCEGNYTCDSRVCPTYDNGSDW